MALAVGLCLTGTAEAQVVVEPDRVLFLGEFVPRCQALSTDFIVPVGQVATIPSGEYDCVENAGTLIVAPNSVVRFVTLLNLPGAILDVQAPCATSTELIVRDVPLGAEDQFQWRNGIVNFGHRQMIGCPKTAWSEMDEAPAGAISITLATTPVGWEVGDELLLSDMRQMTQNAGPRREVLHIAAVAGNFVILDVPLGFSRDAIRRPDGSVVLRPRVANLSRNLVIRSDGLTTPGHIADIGFGSTWDVQYVEYRELGRTKNENISATNFIGKYADHSHHDGDATGTVRRGNSYIGHAGSKWGVTIHNTHNSLIEDNVCTDFPGGCFTTEDGNELGNVFRRNVAAYAIGNGVGAGKNAEGNLCAGCEGSGFWWRGIGQLIEGNEAWNNAIGFNVFNQDFRAPPPVGTIPVAFRDNVTIGNTINGYEQWKVPLFPVERLIAAHSRQRQHWSVISPGSNSVHLIDPILIGTGAVSTCLATSSAYTPSVEVEGGEMRGCRRGLEQGIAGQDVVLRNLVLQNETNIQYTGFPRSTLMENITHVPYGTRPLQYIVFGDGFVWDGVTPRPSLVEKGGRYLSQRGSPHQIINWQGSWQNYTLYELQQRASTIAWVADWPNGPPCCGTAFYTPEAGLTMGQAWTKYGLAYHGYAIADASAVELDGLINGVASAAPEVLGPARAVLTYPNLLNPAVVNSKGLLELFALLTGENVGRSMLVSYDGGDPVLYDQRPYDSGDTLAIVAPASASTPGLHTVLLRRLAADGSSVVGEPVTASYCVGTECAGTPPPPPPPPPDPDPDPPPTEESPDGTHATAVVHLGFLWTLRAGDQATLRDGVHMDNGFAPQTGQYAICAGDLFVQKLNDAKTSTRWHRWNGSRWVEPRSADPCPQ